MADTTTGSGGSRSWWTGEGIRWTIVTLLIPFAGLVWNEVQERDVERQKRLERVRAEEQTRVINARNESDIVIKLMPALSSDDSSPTRGIALAVLLNLSSREALSPELASSVQVAIEASQQRLREGKATEGERAALSKIAKANDRDASRGDAVKAPSGEGAAAAPEQTYRLQVPRVYIQIFGEADSAAARALQEWITSKQRWLAPGIEDVVATAARAKRPVPIGADAASVRYFNAEDAGRAEEVATHMRGSGTPNVKVQLVNVKAPAGQIEVWFPKRSA